MCSIICPTSLGILDETLLRNLTPWYTILRGERLEMERDAVAAHGLSKFLKEKLMDNSDAFATYVCGKCGLFAQRARRRNNKKFPQSTDIYHCAQCDNFNDIHKIMIPYAFKLLLQELMSMCIAPRIRVDKPIYDL
jgi:DNA-directed RNA polymerase II subunit RPB2